MVTLEEILKKRFEIKQRMKDWGYNNPRLFKGLIIKNEDSIINDGSHILNFLVDENNDEIPIANKRMLELDLERLLTNCRVIVSLKDEFNEESEYKIKEAVSFDSEVALREYFGPDWQFEELKLNEKELATQNHAYDNLDFIKNGIKAQIGAKRARSEEDTNEPKNQPSQEEKAQIDKIEREVSDLSPSAREELFTRFQKYKEQKVTSVLPPSKPISGVS